MQISPEFRLPLLLLALAGAVAVATAGWMSGHAVWAVCAAAAAVAVGVRIWRRQQSQLKCLLRLLEGVKYQDFSVYFPTEGKAGDELRLARRMNGVVEHLRTTHQQWEERHSYYETLLNLIDSCLLVIDGRGQVVWMNLQAELQLGGHTVHSLAELAAVHPDLPQLIGSIRPGQLRSLRIYRRDVAVDMALTVTEYRRGGVGYRLVHLRNVRSLLEENEMEAWQKLVRVLTHEIMNSIAPIISLSETLGDCAAQPAWAESNRAVLLQGLRTIRRRSKGLLGFVENYRKLTRLPAPRPEPVRVGDLLGDLGKLCAGRPVSVEMENPDRVVWVDRALMEQVLLNLMKNAAEACAEQSEPRIRVSTGYDDEQRLFSISVADNGPGILPEVLDKIFVPFFTTKPDGSGIGLSLCKQIVNLHGGSIAVRSRVGEGSCFTLKLVVPDGTER